MSSQLRHAQLIANVQAAKNARVSCHDAEEHQFSAQCHEMEVLRHEQVSMSYGCQCLVVALRHWAHRLFLSLYIYIDI